jgi:hypothetical protein
MLELCQGVAEIAAEFAWLEVIDEYLEFGAGNEQFSHGFVGLPRIGDAGDDLLGCKVECG